jgi:hypothetical protein
MVQITNHYERAIALLASQFRETASDGGKTLFQKLISVFVGSFQELDDVNQELLTKRWLDTAEGVQLDGIGQIVGLERTGGQTDDDYREALQFQIFINGSNSTPEEAIKVLKFLTKGTNVWYHELIPAAFEMRTDGTSLPSPPNILVTAMNSISPAAVQYIPIGVRYFDGLPLGFSSDPILEDFYVAVGDPTNLHPLEVNDNGDIDQLLINRGETFELEGIGVLAEVDYVVPNAGHLAEVIYFNGNFPPAT